MKSKMVQHLLRWSSSKVMSLLLVGLLYGFVHVMICHLMPNLSITPSSFAKQNYFICKSAGKSAVDRIAVFIDISDWSLSYADDQDSDSDSDASIQRNRDSMSLASSHSSDEEEEETGVDLWKTAPTKVNLPGEVIKADMRLINTFGEKSDFFLLPWPGLFL